jgi:hypothetical protein
MSPPARRAASEQASEPRVEEPKSAKRTMMVGYTADNRKTTYRVRSIPMTYDDQMFHIAFCQALGLVTGNDLIVHSLSKDVKNECTASVTLINCLPDILLEAPSTSEVEEVSKTPQIWKIALYHPTFRKKDLVVIDKAFLGFTPLSSHNNGGVIEYIHYSIHCYKR